MSEEGIATGFHRSDNAVVQHPAPNVAAVQSKGVARRMGGGGGDVVGVGGVEDIR